MSFFEELKRRNVFRMGIAYAVVAWVLLQAIDFSLDIISAPNWVMQVFLLAGVAGLPLVLIFSWIFEMTPEGIKLESEIDRSQSVTPGTGRKLDRTIIIFLALAVALLLTDRFINTGSDDPLPEDPVVTVQQTVESAEPDTAAPASNIQSIAVLPFVNMSSDPEQEYFSDGLSEELLNRLAKNDQLQVAARTSSFQFKGQNQDISAIGRQLKVAHILEGSVRKSANRLRITAQLIEVDSGYHLWSETYEREIDDVFAIQDDISAAITKALEAELGTADEATGSHLTNNLEAYQLYLEARYLLAKRGEPDMLKADELFEQAVALDPTFSKAWSGMAFNYSLLPAYGSAVSMQQATEKVALSANKAIQLDPDNAEGHIALARSIDFEDFELAQKHFEKAYLLAPNDANVINLYADNMTEAGNFQAAEQLELKAIELDPLAAVHYSDIAFIMFSLKRNAEGLNYARTSASLAPDSIDRADPLVIGLAATGKHDEAIEVIQRFEQQADVDPGIINAWWSMLYYQQGDRQKLREKVVERIDNVGNGTGSHSYVLAAFYTAWLDGTDAALPLLVKSYARKEYLLSWPEYFYLPEDISDDPEWLAFWQQPGLVDLVDTRRINRTQEHIGHWKERPAQ